MVLIPVSLVLALGLRLGEFIPSDRIYTARYLFLFLLVLAPVLSIILSVHKMKLQSFGNWDSLKIGMFAGCLAVIGSAVNWGFGLGAPRTVPMIFGFVFFVLASYFRLAAQRFLVWLAGRKFPTTPVAVYGAGAAGLQLILALRQSREVKPVMIVDDNTSMQGVVISGLSVQNPGKLAAMVKLGKVKRVLLAMPSAPRERLDNIIKELGHLSCEIQVLPSFIDLISGDGLVESLRPVSIDDLMERDTVGHDFPEIVSAYSGQGVMITGAGGSIGAELCRQILQAKPAKLVLFEMSEIALYSIDREIRALAKDTRIETVLGSISDARLVEKTITDQEVSVIIHAAAYKHVPLIETNELEGIRNNVLGTKVLADSAKKLGIDRFILISSDKAVRPTNIMGATKRLAELVIQDLQTRSNQTKFSMVRFGNVMGSSGSVIPLFREQIAAGGPVTVTDKNMTRFFMTIPEAAKLVLLAGTYAKGGDVFVLDMGQQVRIYDMAKRMISLSGLSQKTAENPNGDIEIIFTGTRPGEKLYEELLIGDDTLPTPHEKIMRAQEQFLSKNEILAVIDALNIAIDTSDIPKARGVIERWVEGYHQPERGRHD